MSLKYTCPSCGTPLGYEGLCWKCKCEQERQAALAWTPEQITKKQKNLIQNIQRLADMEDPEFTDFWQLLGYHDAITPEIQRVALAAEVFWPCEIYYHAPADVRDGLIHALLSAEYSSAASNLMSCLAMQLSLIHILMPQEESEKYLSLLKKGLSGSLGKNLIDIVFSTQQVVDSEEHRLLTTLRDSQLKDNEARQTFYHKVIDSLDMGDSSYLLLLACDSYDVPHRGKDDSLQADASDEVFTYIVCVVCPIKEGKVELGYFPGDNEFHCAAGQTVAPPELGFLFPAFDDRAANIYNALFYSRKANEIHQEFIDAIFHVEAPMSAVEQKEAFQSALSDAFDCSLEVMQTVHEQLREKIKEHRESRSSEPLEMSASEIGQILQSCGIADEQVAAFQENCGEQFGSGVVLNPANLIDSSRFEIKTPEITISADPEYSYLVETQIINGRKYLLIPTEDGVEVNGFAVSITAAQKDD